MEWFLLSFGLTYVLREWGAWLFPFALAYVLLAGVLPVVCAIMAAFPVVRLLVMLALWLPVLWIVTVLLR